MSKATYAWSPDRATIEGSNLTRFMKATGIETYDQLLTKAYEHPGWFWRSVLSFCDIQFFEPFKMVRDESKGIANVSWCVGGTTNLVLNCLDKHRDTPVYDQTFIVSCREDGQRSELTYRQFDALVCRVAGALKAKGIKRGDVIALHLPMVPEAFATFFATLKIGAIIAPMFSGFGSHALQSRLGDARARLLVTFSGTTRRGQPISNLPTLHEALPGLNDLQHILMLDKPRDLDLFGDSPVHDWQSTIDAADPEATTEALEPDAAGVLMYTSGTTGKPKGIIWSHIGFVTKMSLDMGVLLDFRKTDRYIFPSDMGWMVGPMAAVVPSLAGGSVVLMDGAPDYPEHDRLWRVVNDEKVTYLGVSPTLVRVMRKRGADGAPYPFESLRIAMSAGEVFDSASWCWFFEKICRNKVPVLNYSGGTEVGGGILTSTLHHPINPGSFAGPIPGMGADIVDESGKPVPPGQVGELVLRKPSIGLTRGLWNDPGNERYLESYWEAIPGLWVHGDLTKVGEDGLYYILGRSDDTLKIAGKRVGPGELENVLMGSGKLIEAAAVSLPDETKGASIVCVCVPHPEMKSNASLPAELGEFLAKTLGPTYRPSRVILADDLPKTRNLKVMRRVIRATLMGNAPGDVSAIVNPEAIDGLARLLESRPQ
jgi:acetyl-CoA synthetase